MEKMKRYNDFEQVNGAVVNGIIDHIDAVNEINIQLNKQINAMSSAIVPPNGDIYKIGLNDYIHEKDLIITRVPGGWLYAKMETYDGQTMVLPPVFVPMHKEFDTGKNMEVVEFPKVEKTEGTDFKSYNQLWSEMSLPNDCVINCKHLDIDNPIDESKKPLYSCTVENAESCPIIKKQWEEQDQ